MRFKTLIYQLCNLKRGLQKSNRRIIRTIQWMSTEYLHAHVSFGSKWKIYTIYTFYNQSSIGNYIVFPARKCQQKADPSKKNVHFQRDRDQRNQYYTERRPKNCWTMKRNACLDPAVESNLINAGVATNNIALFIGYIRYELLHCQSRQPGLFARGIWRG